MVHRDAPPRGRVLLGATGLAIVLVALHATSHPLLRGPDLTSPSTWGAWAARAGAVGVLMSTLRLLAIGLCWYVVVVVALRIAAVATSDDRLASAVALLAGDHAHGVVVALVGTGLVATTVPSASAVPAGMAAVEAESDPARPGAGGRVPPDVHGAAAGADADDRSDDRDAGRAGARSRRDDLDAVAPPRLVPVLSAPAPRLRPLPRDPGPDAGSGVAADLDSDLDGPDRPVRRDTTAGPDWWTVRPGDHFWRIAEEHLERTRSQPPDEAAVRRHWRRVVRLNRDELVDADDPDLLLPGQVLRLPPVPSVGDGAPVPAARA